MNKLDITFENTQFIRDREGFKSHAYPDPVTHGKPFTIAWGLTGDWVTPNLTLTTAQAQIKFMAVIDNFCNQIANLVTINLTLNQKIALLSFTYNLGIGALAQSTLLKKLNNNDPTVADEFLKWDRAAGKEISGLKNRRELEKALFLS